MQFQVQGRVISLYFVLNDIDRTIVFKNMYMGN